VLADKKLGGLERGGGYEDLFRLHWIGDRRRFAKRWL
jgi:hypothetical protein